MSQEKAPIYEALEQGGRTACSRSIWRGRRISYGWGNNILGSDHDSYLL